MVKKFKIKLNIKNPQLAKAINISKEDATLEETAEKHLDEESSTVNKKTTKTPAKSKTVAKAKEIANPKKSSSVKTKDAKEKKSARTSMTAPQKTITGNNTNEKPTPTRLIRARKTSAFAHKDPTVEEIPLEAEPVKQMEAEAVIEEPTLQEETLPPIIEQQEVPVEVLEQEKEPIVEEEEEKAEPTIEEVPEKVVVEDVIEPIVPKEEPPIESKPSKAPAKPALIEPAKPAPIKLGPTGRHIKDLYSELYDKKEKPSENEAKEVKKGESVSEKGKTDKTPPKKDIEKITTINDTTNKSQPGWKTDKTKPSKLKPDQKGFAKHRNLQALLESSKDEGGGYGKPFRKNRQGRRSKQLPVQANLAPMRPKSLSIRLPILIKDLAAEMKLKVSQIISKLFMQGISLTLNDILADETIVQLIGEEFDCKITIDTSEEERIRITSKTIREEVDDTHTGDLVNRPPVITFMGHVDHGKTSIIDAIRTSTLAADEKGAITQHIGAFCCHTPVGDITILDTPGHEAFSAMRARGADVTDIVILVIAGDEGVRQQTIEAMQHAKAANVTTIVAINKSDKPNFDAEKVYRQLADNELLPEAWGGTTITVNCSAETKEGINDLLEMVALQAEVLELKASPTMRARGTVIESEMHKGLGATTTLLIQNGTLKKGDAIVFNHHWARVKTMSNEMGEELDEAGLSSAVRIAGLSGLPEAGSEFVAVENEREAKNIAEIRMKDFKELSTHKPKKISIENMLQEVSKCDKKTLNVLLRADTQGSLEAIKTALLKIESEKVELNIIFSAVGEVAESDVQLAQASKAIIIGFHTQVESHAEDIIKQTGVILCLHDIIYHAIDNARDLMTGLLDKLAQEKNTGSAEVKATFKSSQLGIIAGCYVTDGIISRNHRIRVVRNGEVIWKGPIASIKREHNDVKEVLKGLECGIVLDGFTESMEGDILEAFEIIYIEQQL